MDPKRAKEVGDTITGALGEILSCLVDGTAITLLIRSPGDAPDRAWMISTEKDPMEHKAALMEAFSCSIDGLTKRGFTQEDLGNHMQKEVEKKGMN